MGTITAALFPLRPLKNRPAVVRPQGSGRILVVNSGRRVGAGHGHLFGILLNPSAEWL